ncbi:MAG TPA: metallophosphoesterase [Tepidisphaeraceae bacterium]|jgi:predicted phosphodiesterase|nr:metallophosphoesterase [Tepidisphaeraceae bacterium]
MNPTERRPIVFVWPGDLHLTTPDQENYKIAQWMAREVNTLVRPDFVQFAGDNVQHAQESEFAMFRDICAALQVPYHALVGDHDAHHDGGCHAFEAHIGPTFGAFSSGGFRFIRLNTMQSRPLGISAQQLHWFRFEVDAARARGERVVIFQHHYPFKVCESFAGPGIEQWRRIVQTRPITAIFCGHTHYGQLANDGRNVYVTTRSIGDPEGGEAGYAIVYLEGEDLALTYRTTRDNEPIVLITHPRQLILATAPAHIVSGPELCRAHIWSSSPIKSAQFRVDGGTWADLCATGVNQWEGPIAGERLRKGEHTLEVRVSDSEKGSGGDCIRFLVDRSGRYTALPQVEPIVKETKFC